MHNRNFLESEIELKWDFKDNSCHNCSNNKLFNHLRRTESKIGLFLDFRKVYISVYSNQIFYLFSLSMNLIG